MTPKTPGEPGAPASAPGAPPPRPRKTSRPLVDWQKVRAEYEAGGPRATFRALAARYNVSHTAVRQRADREGWQQNLEPTVRAATDALVSGVTATADPKKQAQAIAEEAERRATIIRRHRLEWQLVATLRDEAMAVRAENPALAFERAKLAKITAEMTMIQQAGERRAHRLDDPGEQAPRRVEVAWIDEAVDPNREE
jgi:hypothetical protein